MLKCCLFKFCSVHYFCFLICRLCYCWHYLKICALLRSLLIFICEVNCQFSLELSVELSVALSSNVFGEVAKADPNFYVNRWATSFLITFFMHWWGKRGKTTWQQFGPPVLLILDSSVPLELQSFLEFTLHYWIFYIESEKERQYGEMKRPQL